jgi:hypothetical protein
MTIEEATERILAGNFFLTCPQCRGLGFTRIKDSEQYTEGIGGKFKPCTNCRVSGYIYESTYNQACRVLKMKRVDRPLLRVGSFAEPPTGFQQYLPTEEAIKVYTEEDVAATQGLYQAMEAEKGSSDKDTP